MVKRAIEKLASLLGIKYDQSTWWRNEETTANKQSLAAQALHLFGSESHQSHGLLDSYGYSQIYPIQLFLQQSYISPAKIYITCSKQDNFSMSAVCQRHERVQLEHGSSILAPVHHLKHPCVSRFYPPCSFRPL